jgi:hypothetical protein
MGACVCFRGPNMPRWRNSTGRPLVMLLATLSVVTATLSGGATMFRLFFPKLSVIECAAAAAPIGLTLSAWLALLLKSFLFQSYVAVLTPWLCDALREVAVFRDPISISFLMCDCFIPERSSLHLIFCDVPE